MRNGFTQVSPENALALLATLQGMAARGSVGVTSRGVTGGGPFTGRLTFGFGTLGGVRILEARSGGLVMNTPVMPLGFVPQREDDVVASYRIEGNVACFDYRSTHGAQAWRRFEFSR